MEYVYLHIEFLQINLGSFLELCLYVVLLLQLGAQKFFFRNIYMSWVFWGHSGGIRGLHFT